jgi:polyphosphate kinase 2 (PPK2 family)
MLVTRVHRLISRKTAEKRMKEINQFEKLLASNGTTVLKFFLHISKEEQRRRKIWNCAGRRPIPRSTLKN